jgi:uncharacterized protein
MNPETNLQKLLATMKPELQAGEYVFASVTVDDSKIAQGAVVGWFRESEGITLILERSAATAAGIESSFPSRMITLTVHSSLEAVGFMAVINKRLAAAGISVNAISAYHHDHLFVPLQKADKAVQILHTIMEEAASGMQNQTSTTDGCAR